MSRLDESEELIEALKLYTHQTQDLQKDLSAALTHTIMSVGNLAGFHTDLKKIGKELGSITGIACMNFLSDSFKDFTRHFVEKIGTLTSRIDKITQTQEGNQITVDAVIQSQLLITQNLKDLSDRIIGHNEINNKRITRLENALTYVFEAQAAAIKDQQPAKKA